MVIKGVAFSIFFALFVALTSFYPDWLHYVFYNGPKSSGADNVMLDIASLVIALVAGTLSYVTLAKLKDAVKRVLVFLQKIGEKTKA